MKIVHVYDGHERVFPGEGSVPSLVYQLAKYTAKKGHEVVVLERRWRGTSYEETIEGIEFLRFDLNVCSNVSNDDIVYDLIKKPSGISRFVIDRSLFAFKSVKYLRKINFDVIHVHLPFAANVIINIDKSLRSKMVYTAHIGEEKKRFALDSSAPLLLKLFSPDLYLMKRIRKSVVLNESLKEKLRKKGLKELKLEVIPNGIDVGDYMVSIEQIELIKSKYGLDGKLVVMFSGSVTPRKGVINLIKAVEYLNNPQVLLLIVGNLEIDRVYAKMVMDYVRKNKLNVKFTGFVPYEDLKALYSACDIFVLPSFEEGDPIALKEALASGKPLVGSNVGGIPMQIRDNWNGFLVEPGNYKELGDRIGCLICDDNLRHIMGKNSRKLAEEKFDWSIITSRYLELYNSVV